MRITGKRSEQAGGCTEADSLKSGKQLHNTQIPAKGNETDSTGQLGTEKANLRGRKANKSVPRDRKYEIRPLGGNWGMRGWEA